MHLQDVEDTDPDFGMTFSWYSHLYWMEGGDDCMSPSQHSSVLFTWFWYEQLQDNEFSKFLVILGEMAGKKPEAYASGGM